MIYNIVCRAVLALTVTIVFTTATMSSVFAGKAGPPKNIEASAPEEMMVSSLIVKPHVEAGAQLSSALQAFDARGLSKSALVPLTVVRPMSGKAHVVKLEHPVTLSEARVIAARLMHNDPGIEYAEPDRIMHPHTIPTDPLYGQQWNYFAPAGANQGGTNLPLAWDVTKGSAAIVIAVVDTGYLQHEDFAPVLPGFDFIADSIRANDGDGRDADAHDPGNWVAAGECGVGTPAKDSVWHGTGMIGLLAGLMNNGKGGTGVAPSVRILPVRVSGKCGALMSDMVDGMRWAAGFSVSGVSNNPTPANILNISHGDQNVCGPTLQAAVTEIVNAGKVIVASTENNSAVSISEPANCTGVIAATAHAIDGDVAYYANVGPEVALSAPGGGCGKLKFLAGTCAPGGTDPNGPGITTTFNSGLTFPVADTYPSDGQGTSAAPPHVVGVAALLLSVNPTLTPAQIRSILQSSARPFPAGSWCTTVSGTGLCGAGLLDARAALQVGGVPPTVTITPPSQVVAPNITVSLSGAASAFVGRSISSYAWTQLTGTSVGTIANQNTANASFTAPATGIYSFRLTATDTVGLTGTATATVRVNSPPVLTGVVTAQTVLVGTALSFAVGATDVDGDVPIFVSVSLPPGATLSSTGTFSWPNATPVGSYILTYFARDNDVNSTLGTVNISVTLTLPADITPPTAPATLTASPTSGTQFTLSWPAATDNLGVTGYQVERCQGVGCTTFALIASPTTTGYLDTGLTPGISYSYRVRAQDATGNVSPYSPIITATTTNRTTLFTDTFNRADNTDLGVAYTATYTASTAAKIVLQQVLPVTPNLVAVEHYTGVSTPNDQWCEFTIGVLNGAQTAEQGCFLRMTDPPTESGYFCRAGINQTNKGALRRIDAGSFNTIGNNTTVAWGAGDKGRCEIQGTALKFYRIVGTTETLLLSGSDATYASGTTGLELYVATGGSLSASQMSHFSMGGFGAAAPPPVTAITYDAASSSAAGNTTNSISWNHTVGSGTNRFLAVCTQARDTVAGDVAVNTVTANGFPLTKVRADLRTDGGSSFGTELWYLANLGIGAYTITVTWTGALSSYGVGSATSYFGVDQVTPIDAHTGSGGTGTTLSTAITTVANHAVITDCAIGQANPLTIGAGQSSRVTRDTTGTVDGVGVSTVDDKTPAGTETMDWTQGAAQNWVISAVSLQPAP